MAYDISHILNLGQIKTILQTLSSELLKKSDKSLTFQVTLASNSWSNNTQTVTDSNFVTTGYTYIVSPSTSSFNDYAEAQIYADDVTTASQMTFHCSSTPTSAITVKVVKLQST